MNWFTDFTALEWAYFIIACIGTVLLLVQVILMIVGAGDGVMGRGNSLATLSFYLYNKSFVDGEMGMGSAIGWVIFCISLLFSLGLLVFVQKTGYYSLDD